MSKVRSILEDYLLLGKSVTIAFPSKESFLSFRSQLYTYKSRFNKQLEFIGEEGVDILDGKAIIFEQIETQSGLVTYTIRLGESKPKEPGFKIISIDESEPG